MTDTDVKPRELINNGSMGNTHSKVKRVKGKRSRTKILYRPPKTYLQHSPTEGASNVPSAWFSLPDVTDDVDDKHTTRTRANSLDAGITFCLEHPEALKEPLVQNGVKLIEVTLPKINADKTRTQQAEDENQIEKNNDKDTEECAEDKEIVKIIKLASQHRKADKKQENSNKVELVVNSPRETLLKKYLREIRVSKQNISSITQVTSTTSTETKVAGSLQESQRLLLSRSTPNLIEFDKPLTVKQDSAESLPKLLGTDPFETPPELHRSQEAPKKYPRTFEYDRSRLHRDSRMSAFESTEIHRRRQTVAQQMPNSVDQKPTGTNYSEGKRSMSLYQEPPRRNYQLRLDSQKKQQPSHSLRPISAPTQEVKYRKHNQSSPSNAELRQRRQHVCSYPNIQSVDLDKLMKQEHSKTENSRHSVAHSNEYKEHASNGMENQKNNLETSERRNNSNEELNIWRANREKSYQSQHGNSASFSNSLERRRTKTADTFTYNSQTLNTHSHRQSNVNGFYNELELPSRYNTTDGVRRIHRDDRQASPSNSWSEKSSSSTKPRIEKIVKHTTWEDQRGGLSPMLNHDRFSKSPMTSHGSASPHSSHSDPYDQDMFSHTRVHGDRDKGSPMVNRKEANGGILLIKNHNHRSDTRPKLTFQEENQSRFREEDHRNVSERQPKFADQQRGHGEHKEHTNHHREHVQPHAELIEKNMFSLCEKIDLNESGLWEVLLAKGIITRRKCDKIKAKYPKEADQVSQVLHILEKCSGEDFKAFKAALDATGQGHVVHQLLLSTAGGNVVDRWRISLARYYMEEGRMSDLPLYPLDSNWKAGEIKRYYTRTTFVDVTARGSFTEERAFDMYHQLFVNRGMPLHRVALVGEAGSGKSVLARKMTVDWAQGVLMSYLNTDAESETRGEQDPSGGSEEEAFLRSFKLLVYVDLENLTSSVSVRDLLLHRINYKDQQDCSSIDSFLRDHQRECLLIFDGWDAFQSKTAPALGLIAQGRAMQHTPVLFTYRMESESIPSAVERTFQIRGFDEEQAREYIVKLLYSQGHQSQINKLTGFISKKRLWNKYSSPDALNLLCFAFSKGRNTLPQTKWKIDI